MKKNSDLEILSYSFIYFQIDRSNVKLVAIMVELGFQPQSIHINKYRSTI